MLRNAFLVSRSCHDRGQFSHLLATRVTASSTRARLQPSNKSTSPSKYSIHLHVHMSKEEASLEKLHHPHRTRRDLPHAKTHTGIHHHHQSVSTPTHFSRSPNLGPTVCAPELSFHYCTLFSLLDSQSRLVKVFPALTLAPIPFTATRTTGSSFFLSRNNLTTTNLAPSVTTPHHKPHGLLKIRTSPTSEPLCAACVLCWSFGILFLLVWSGHSHYPLTVRDTRHLPAKAHTRDKEKTTRDALLPPPPDKKILSLFVRPYLTANLPVPTNSHAVAMTLTIEGVRCVLLDIGMCVHLCCV
jgi:hypothetical protein